MHVAMYTRTSELTYVIRHVNTHSHLSEFATWRLEYMGDLLYWLHLWSMASQICSGSTTPREPWFHLLQNQYKTRNTIRWIIFIFIPRESQNTIIINVFVEKKALSKTSGIHENLMWSQDTPGCFKNWWRYRSAPTSLKIYRQKTGLKGCPSRLEEVSWHLAPIWELPWVTSGGEVKASGRNHGNVYSVLPFWWLSGTDKSTSWNEDNYQWPSNILLKSIQSCLRFVSGAWWNPHPGTIK